MQKRRIALFWIKLLAFLMILGMACNVAGGMLGAEGITGYAAAFFHIPRNSVDVVWAGSSHQFCGIIPQLLFDEHGITSALATGIEMDMNSNYWQLRHILLTQRPKLVVLDMFAAASAYAYGPSIGLTPFENKPELLPENRAYALTAMARWLPFNSPYKVPATLEAYERTGEDGPSYFHITKKHKEISYVGKESFSFLTGQTMFAKNFGYSYHAEKLTPERVKLDTYTEEELAGVSLEETNVAELERIIDLCKRENIQLVFSAAPYVMDAAEEKRMALLEAFAQQHGVPFVGPEASGIEDYGYFRDVGHLNYLGAELYTAFWGDYLAGHYDLPDHRNSTDARYAPWQERVGSHQEQVAAYRLYFLDDPSLSDYLEQVSVLGEDYLILLSAEGDVYEGFTEDDYTLMTEELGMTDEATEAWYNAGAGTLNAVVCGGKVLWSHFDEEGQKDAFQLDLKGYHVCFEVKDGTRNCSVDQKPVGTLKEGFNITVYNLLDGGILMDDVRTFDMTEIDMDDE